MPQSFYNFNPQKAFYTQTAKTTHPQRKYSTEALFGKLWDGLETEESDEIRWYLLNCVAGVELDLLAQCREMCKDYPKSDIVRFAVPTMREARSHGKRNVVEDLVLYPGYVFAQLRLCEEVYEEISSLVTCRSWMGTQRRKGNKRLPSVPLPLSEEEIASFKGLEENMEKEKEKTAEDLLKEYEGFEVEGMVKILEGKHAGEDGIIKRLKGGKVSVRLFTYGSQFDEWLRPDQIRPLTELEVMKGLTGRETPIRQDDFDQSMGRPLRKSRGNFDESSPTFSKRNMRNELMSNVKGQRRPRNRQQDRIGRGERGGRDTDRWGNSREQLRKENENWQKYKKRKIDQQMNQNSYDVDSQWGRGGNKKSKNRDINMDDWSQFTSSTSTDTSNPSNNKEKVDNEDDFFNDLMSELSDTLQQNPDTSKADEQESSKSEDDFFSSLMSELSSDTEPSQTASTTNVDSSTDNEEDFFATLEKEMSLLSDKEPPSSIDSSNADPLDMESVLNSDSSFDTEDDFFAQLESSLSSNLDTVDPDTNAVSQESTPSTKTTVKPKSKLESKAETAPSKILQTDLSKLTVPVLKNMLKEKGLKVSGKKAELIERLMN